MDVRLAASALLQATDKKSADIAALIEISRRNALIEISRRNSEGISALLEATRRNTDSISTVEDAFGILGNLMHQSMLQLSEWIAYWIT